MRRLTFVELDQRAVEFDALVAHTPDVDRYCSSSLWAAPAQAAFAPHAQPYIAHSDAGYVAMMAIRVQGGTVAVPLEASWGLASPFVGPDPAALVDLLVELDRQQPLRGLFLSGLARGGVAQRAAIRAFVRAGRRVGIGPDTPRRVADLSGGLDGFLSRRSARFRANLRRAERKAYAAGFTWSYLAPTKGADDLFERILAVERRSWKGREGLGIDDGDACDFYRDVTARLVARGALRVVFIESEGQDRAYVFGGLLGDTYRGLQVSFDHEFADFALGNLAQYAMIQGLCEEGLAAYDLGTDIPYKHHWSEAGLTTLTVAVLPR